ncbi:hypothetical protein [Devosia chinhatensis]|uniref:Tat pathway signal sequence domain protein n=1 Tax=Devosia chinhatensis TaxID=429727 RepID=A0A0F5FLW3_9HYPH|nr:hypothetical protein [Devosia chinhatensis]KKB09894.1 hypothetical protein VE26_08705 [Devosia chinhatensis]
MRILFALAIAATTSLVPAHAQEALPAGLSLELNAVQPADAGCRLTFLAVNGFEDTLERASVETALFDSDGAIERIVTLDFKALSPGKTKVLQFELAGLDCTNLSRVLINDITACDGEGLAADSCMQGLATHSRTNIDLGV